MRFLSLLLFSVGLDDKKKSPAILHRNQGLDLKSTTFLDAQLQPYKCGRRRIEIIRIYFRAVLTILILRLDNLVKLCSMKVSISSRMLQCPSAPV